MPALMPPYTCYKCQKFIPYGEPVAFCNINMTGAANMSPSQCEPHCNDCSPFSLAAWQQSGDSGLTGSIAKELTAARGRVAALEKENAAVREQWSKQSETLSAMIQGRMAEASRASLAEEKLRKAEGDRDALRADAERYRWMADNTHRLKVYVYDDPDDACSGDWLYKPRDLNEVIDAAKEPTK